MALKLIHAQALVYCVKIGQYYITKDKSNGINDHKPIKFCTLKISKYWLVLGALRGLLFSSIAFSEAVHGMVNNVPFFIL